MVKPAAVLAVCACLLPAGRAAAQDAEPTIRATATEVLLDLVVRDKHGKPVKNLKPGDVQIFEDGTRRDVKSFHFFAARETSVRLSGDAKAAAAATAPARRLHAVSLICIVFHNLDPVSRSRAIEAVQEFLKNDLQPDTYVGLFTLDNTLTPIYAFTNDRQELARAAADAFRLRPLDFDRASQAVLTANPTQVIVDTITDTVAHTSTTAVRVAGGELSRTVIAGADVNTAPGANIIRGEQVAEARDFADITGMQATDRINAMMAVLGRLPGHKSVLLLTTGLQTTGDPDEFDKILAKAKKTDITVYAMDVAGLSHVSTSQAADIALGHAAGVSRTQTQIGGSLAAAEEKSRQGDSINQAVRTSDSQSSLRALSEGTGGFLIANTNEFRKPFQHIVDDLDTHYEVSYQPAPGKEDGRLRRIEVKLARPDWRVESRTGYFAMPDLEGAKPLTPFEVLGLAVLNAKPLPHAFDFHVAALEFRNHGPNRQGLVVFQLPGASLGAAPQPGRGTHLLHAYLMALVKDASGQVVDEYSLDAPYEAPDANLKAIQAAAFTYTHPLSLAPGRYSVETAVIDPEGGRASTNVLPFDVLAAPAGVGMSSAILVQNIEPAGDRADASDPLTVKNKRLIPFVGSSLKPDANPYVYFLVYPDPSRKDKPKLQVQFRVGTEVLADQTSNLPAPDASGAIPMIIRAAKHTGECELRITALQGGESVTRTLRYTVLPR